ncbi:Oidioi.mRNA.OKI2018_I69.chr1.g667.t1.cds [Oikopleura dioica]|uniref:Oidioi.mRNA.OKI2018_I69.chr1.g667.t1.cds n=1 Tax=Oikopleura dioica TaxID=34765 RepID=A0ABN7SKJ4_OIKDI|nr:Oidioi.mRNA.OKI2018_I69.chr1.g667.t1.cds [Oikopleura dioica]
MDKGFTREDFRADRKQRFLAEKIPEKTIFKRYGDENGIGAAIPYYGSYGGGYPARFQPQFFKPPIIFTNQSIRCHHRFNPDIEPGLFPGAKFFTSIREPFEAFKSNFNYHYGRFFNEKNLERRERWCTVGCWGEPFRSIVGKLNVSAAEYLDVVEKKGLPADEKTPWLFRAKNFQGFELGMDHNNFDIKYIYDEILRLDDIFDLVMVQEYFFESLVLLAEELCTSFKTLYASTDRMVSMPRLKEKNSNAKFTDQQMKTFRKDNIQDYAIYEFFNKTLWEKIDRYGHERMKKDVEKLKMIYKECDEDESLCGIEKRREPSGKAEFDPGTKKELLQLMAENGGACATGVFPKLRAGNQQAATMWTESSHDSREARKKIV